MARARIFMYVSDMPTWVPEGRIEIHSADFFLCGADWSWSVRNLPNLDLWYVTEGVGWIEDAGERFSIGSGDCLVLRRGGSYDAGHDPRRPLNLVAVHFDLLSGHGKRLDPKPDDTPPFIQPVEAATFVRELLERSVHAYRDGCREWASAWLQAALMEVMRQHARTWPAGLIGDQARKIEQICERIRRSPGRAVSVEELAAEMHVSPEHFCRIFRRLQGIPPRSFITRARIEAAQTLLLTSSHSIERIAELIGYESAFYFSRQFKSKVGVSPSAFRRGERRTTPHRPPRPGSATGPQ